MHELIALLRDGIFGQSAPILTLLSYRLLLLTPAPQVVPTRKVRSKKKGGAAAAAAGAGGPAAAAAAAAVGEEEEEEEEGGALNPDDLLPRTDISGSITPALLSMISSSNWKERNAGVDQVRRVELAGAGLGCGYVCVRLAAARPAHAAQRM